MTKKQLQFSTRGTYIAPECIALEIKSQGIICQSTDDVEIPDWEDGGTFPFDF